MKIRKLSALSAILCICLSTSGCGGVTTRNSAAASSAQTTTNEETTTTTTAMKIYASDEDLGTRATQKEFEGYTGRAYDEPLIFAQSSEILEADFSSGLVQIEDDLFRTGGYYTVDSLIEEFSDRYNFSEINTGEETEPDQQIELYANSKSGSGIELHMKVLGVPGADGGNGRLGDAVVVDIRGYAAEDESNPFNDLSWLPRGINPDGTAADGSDLREYLDSIGLRKVTLDEISLDPVGLYNVYWCDDENDRLLGFCVIGTEENLLGHLPLYGYIFIYDPDLELNYIAHIVSSRADLFNLYENLA